MKEELANIKELEKDPSDYDLLVIGTPVWAGKMSTPVRAYINEIEDKVNNVALFCTMNSKGDESTLKGMEELIGKMAMAKSSFTSGDIKNGSYLEGVGKFIDMIII